jgi:hypothetical protein
MVAEEEDGEAQAGQRPDYGVPGSEGNPSSRYCGISYEEARRFCHLPANESFPCPDGDDDCPYDLPCWTLDVADRCTMPPTTAEPTVLATGAPTSSHPTLRPSPYPSISVPPTPGPTTESPITRVSDYPGDHNFCGVGFDNLFDW